MSCRECSTCHWFGNEGICPKCGAVTSWDEQEDEDSWAMDHEFASADEEKKFLEEERERIHK